NEIITPPDPPVAGKGGPATLRVTLQHHGNTINNGMIWVKYNSEVKPADTVGFDDSMVVTLIDNRPLARFDTLRQGTYYFWGMGFDNDPLIQDTVVGGGVFVIPDMDTTAYDLYLNVSELNGH